MHLALLCVLRELCERPVFDLALNQRSWPQLLLVESVFIRVIRVLTKELDLRSYQRS